RLRRGSLPLPHCGRGISCARRSKKMAGQIIDLNLPDGRSRAYVARPGRGSGPGLLLLGDNSVLDPPLRDAADLYAEEGYVVLAPEIEAVEDVAPAIAAMKALPGCVGGVGG